jgi:glycosyltransferase involved in cell wall biosynthesis
MTRARRLDVAFPLLGTASSGGARMLVHAANALAARGRSVALSIPARTAGPAVPLHSGVTVLVRRAQGGLRGRISFVTELPDATVHVASGYQTPALIALGSLLARRKPRVVYLIQGDEIASHIALGRHPAWAKAALRAVARAGYRVPATRLAVSRFVAQRVGAGRVRRVIPPGVDASLLRPVERRPGDPRIRVGVLSHPAPVKGMDVALEAFARLRDDARFRLLLFEGTFAAPAPPFVERFSSLSGPGGHTPDIDAFYSSCDVFVFPSRVEGFGLPPLEAMARGAAVVASDCGGVREYAQPEENCILVPPGDPAALAAAVFRLAEPGLRARLARAGRETAERYPADRFARECADEIERVLEAAGAPKS